MDIENYNKKIYMIRPQSAIEKLSGDSRKNAIKRDWECLNELFIFIDTGKADDRKNIIDLNKPVIYYAGSDKNAIKYFEKSKIPKNNQYNKPVSSKLSGNKWTFYRTFQDADFLPKTVETKEKALAKLKFPVVAKLRTSSSGYGIKKFNAPEELKLSDFKFSVFSEYIKFKQEFRALFVRNKIVEINERIPKINENVTIENKEVEQNVKFVYVVQNIQKDKNKEKIKKIAKNLKDKMDIDIFSIDYVVDKNNKIWILETNAETGMGSAKLAKVYMEIYQQFFNKELPQEYKDYLIQKYIIPGYKMNYPKYLEEISSSPNAIDYKALTK